MPDQIEITRADLAWALKAALPHAGRDDFMPALCGVRLDVDPEAKFLYCVATDRYTIGCARVPIIAGDHPAADVTLPLAEARELLRRLKGKDPSPLQVSREAVTFDGFYRYRPVQMPPLSRETKEFPDWRKVLGGMVRKSAELPADGQGYNPAYLSRFSTASTRHTPVSVYPVKGPMTVVLGENFAGAVIGVRSASNNPTSFLAAWRDALPEVTK